MADDQVDREELELWYYPLARVWTDRSVGFIGIIVQSIVTFIATVLSPHFWLQSVWPTRRFVLTDVYFTIWAVFAVAATLCAFDVVPHGFIRCFLTPQWVDYLLAWRLAEALARELWIILYRRQPLTAPSRVLVVVLIDYATVTALFGYLYKLGAKGYEQAVSVSFTMSTNLPYSESPLALIQTTYCFLFLVIIVATFIGRIKFSPNINENKVEKAISVLDDASGQVSGLREKILKIPELEKNLEAAKTSIDELTRQLNERSEAQS